MTKVARKFEIVENDATARPVAAGLITSLGLAPITEPFPLNDIRRPLRLFMLSDALALLSGFVAAWLVAAAINQTFFGRDFYDLWSSDQLPRLGVFALIGCGVMLWLNQHGHYRMRLPFWTEVQQISTMVFFCILIDSFAQFAMKHDLSRLWLIGSWISAGVMIMLFRTVLRKFMQRTGAWDIRTLLVGDGPAAEDAYAAISSEKNLGHKVVGQINDLAEQLDDAGGSWTRLCNWYRADYVLIALDGPELQQAEDAIGALTREKVPFAISPPLRGVPVLGMHPQYFFNHDVVLFTRCNKLEEPLARVVKRSFDLVCATLGLITLAPLFAAIALMIRRDGGKAFYFDRRIGVGGKVFNCIKFRSMIADANDVLQKHLAQDSEAAAEWQRDQKLRNDPRVTRLGAFIRATSIDELPQLINVVRGEMSLVGPRPINPTEIARYGDDATFYHAVRPGLTGLWQVSGRNDVSYERRVQLDRWYVRNWSLWHDIAIICKTIPALLRRSGAY